MSYLAKNGDKLFVRQEVGPWKGLYTPEIKEEQLIHRWTGPKKSMEDWKQVLAFFEWSQEQHKSEALVQWFVDLESGRWMTIVPPQRGIGMTVKLIEDHPNYKASYEHLGSGDWQLMGTGHHHCTGSAFQSSTDSTDEATKEGLHITVGGIGSDRYSLDARCVFRKLITKVELSDWFAVPEMYSDLPGDIQSQILKHLLAAPPSGKTPGEHFPIWWSENYIRETQVTTVSGGFSYRGWTPGHSTSVPGYCAGSGGGYQRSEWTTQRLRNELDHFINTRGMSIEQFINWIEELQVVDGVDDIFKICDQTYSDLGDVLVAAYAMAEDAERKVLGFSGADQQEFSYKPWD